MDTVCGSLVVLGVEKPKVELLFSSGLYLVDLWVSGLYAGK